MRDNLLLSVENNKNKKIISNSNNLMNINNKFKKNKNSNTMILFYSNKK